MGRLVEDVVGRSAGGCRGRRGLAAVGVATGRFSRSTTTVMVAAVSAASTVDAHGEREARRGLVEADGDLHELYREEDCDPAQRGHAGARPRRPARP